MIESVVKQIVDNIDASVIIKQPEQAVIRDIIDKMRLALYPEYLINAPKTTSAFTHIIGNALEDVFAALVGQGVPREDAEVFIGKVPRLRDKLLTDVDAAFNGDPAAYNKAEIVISYPGLYAVTVQRMAHELYLLNIPLIPRIMTEHAHSKTGIDIHPGASIGDYFFIDHGTGVVIGETTVIGSNVKIYQGVTLGALSTRGGQRLRGVKRHPTLEDNVTVYSGASILGGDTVIGEGVTIGSSVFIIKSIPAGMRVALKTPDLIFKDPGKKELPAAVLEHGEF